MRILKLYRDWFRIFSFLPIDGKDFSRFKCLEALRIAGTLFPPLLFTSFLIPFIVLNITDIGKVTDASYITSGYVISICNYSSFIWNKKQLMRLLDTVENLLNRSKHQTMPIQLFIDSIVNF